MGQVCSKEWARREALVLGQIERAALAGEAAPSHDRICEATGLASVQGVVARLVRLGRLRVHAKYPGRKKSNQVAYEVLDADSPACGLRTGMNGHQSQRDAQQRDARTKRPCISCSSKMYSTGPHHRMCDRCRARGADTLPELTLSTGTWHPTTRGGVV